MTIKNDNSRLVHLSVAVTENTTAMLAYWDNNLVCRYANPAYFDWFGVRPEQLIDKMTLRDLLGPLFELNYPYINSALAGKTQIFEREITSPNGRTRKSLATYSPDFNEGKVAGFYVHVADISALSISINPLSPGENPSGIAQPGYNSRLINEVIETLKSSLFAGFPGIASLSKKHFISESKLKRDFKNVHGTTIFACYRNMQMKLADQLLRDDRYTKKQLAELLHFSNPANFSACLKNYMKDKVSRETIADLIKANDEQNKQFISQTPFCIAMLDEGLRFLAASQQYVTYYQLFGKKIIGENIYHVFPKLEKKWEKLYLESLGGEIHEGENEFDTGNSTFWLRWDIRPWYKNNDVIGGILIFTEDITARKKADLERSKIFEILDKANEIARIGTWKRNFKTGITLWSKVTREILEVPEDFEGDFENGLKFYKEGTIRETVMLAINNAVAYGVPFDIETELLTAKGNTRFVRIIAYPEFINGQCERLFGIFQDISAYHNPSQHQ